MAGDSDDVMFAESIVLTTGIPERKERASLRAPLPRAPSPPPAKRPSAPGLTVR
jgi:hypothetical protein